MITNGGEKRRICFIIVWQPYWKKFAIKSHVSHFKIALENKHPIALDNFNLKLSLSLLILINATIKINKNMFKLKV